MLLGRMLSQGAPGPDIRRKVNNHLRALERMVQRAVFGLNQLQRDSSAEPRQIGDPWILDLLPDATSIRHKLMRGRQLVNYLTADLTGGAGNHHAHIKILFLYCRRTNSAICDGPKAP